MLNIGKSRFSLRTRWLVAAVLTCVVTGGLPASSAYADEPMGTIIGFMFHDGAAPGPAGVLVSAYGSDGNFASQTVTSPSGYFALSLVPDDYQLVFEMSGGFSWSYHQKPPLHGDVLTVTAGGFVSVSEIVPPRGAIAGTLRTSSGSAAANATVNVRGVDVDTQVSMLTDADGHWSVPYALAGHYIVSFAANGVTQYAHQKPAAAQADPIEVIDNQTTIVDEQLLATGAIRGRITDSGQPIASAGVAISNTVGTDQPVFQYTDANGEYRIAALPGTYTVTVRTPDQRQQWAHGKLRAEDADVFTVSPNVDTVVDEEFLPPSRLSGRLADANGQPVPGVSITASNIDMGAVAFASTDSDGRWSVEAEPGTYKVAYQTPWGTQYSHAATSFETADPITVLAGQTVTLNDSTPALGTVTLSATDASTGQPIAGFCAYLPFAGPQCTPTGTLSFPVLPGTRSVYISPSDPDLVSTSIDVMVVSGQTTTRSISLIRTGTITTTVKDAATGAPVADICVEAVPTTEPSALGTHTPRCSDANGAVAIPFLEPGRYNLFAWAEDGVHGHQWVGSNAGVGVMTQAKAVTVTAGHTVAVSPVKVDRRATITGVVTDKDTGAALVNAFVGLSTFTLAGHGRAQEVTDAQGRYTFDQLGPYEWPLFFSTTGQYAAQWSGHTANRLQAKTVKAKVGKVKAYNVRLTKGVTLTGAVTRSGAPVGENDAVVSVINAASRDELGTAFLSPNGSYTIQVLGQQDIKLYIGDQVTHKSFYYLNAADFQTATTIHLPNTHGDKDVNIRLPAA